MREELLADFIAFDDHVVQASACGDLERGGSVVVDLVELYEGGDKTFDLVAVEVWMGRLVLEVEAGYA